MNQLSKITLSLMSLLLLLSLGAPTVVKLFKKLDGSYQLENKPYVIEVVEEGIPDTLSLVSGDDVLGMVLYALDGDLVLILDGIRIEEDSDLDYVNLSGVAGAIYKLTVDRSGNIPLVVADVRR